MLVRIIDIIGDHCMIPVSMAVLYKSCICKIPARINGLVCRRTFLLVINRMSPTHANENNSFLKNQFAGCQDFKEFLLHLSLLHIYSWSMIIVSFQWHCLTKTTGQGSVDRNSSFLFSYSFFLWMNCNSQWPSIFRLACSIPNGT